MNKETEMNPSIENLRVNTIIDLLRNMDSDSLDRIIIALEVELRARDAEEQAKEDYLDLLSQQYRPDMLHGRTNALEGL